MKKISLIFLFIFAMFGQLSFGTEEVLTISLDDCIIKAMQNNLNIAVEVYNPEIADVSVLKSKEQFMPTFDLTLGNRRNENPSYWFIQGAETVIDKYRNYSLSVKQKIPYGGNFSISLDSYKSDTNAAFQLINPRFGSTLRFDFSQPLLKDFGFKVSRKEILLARNNLDISQNQFKTILMDTVYLVQEGYWNLVYAIEDFKVKQQSLQLARDLLKKNKKEVEVGKIAPIEILNAEAVVATREADILQAETLIRKMEDNLKNLLNLSIEGGAELEKIVPLDEPRFEKVTVSFEAALQQAVQNRPDIKINATTIKTNELNFKVAKNQMLPGLSLDFSYWSPGISGDRVLYLNDNPFSGIIVGKEEGSAGSSIKDAFNQLYKNWTVGLTLSVPLSNFTSRADLVTARMQLEQSLVAQENVKKLAVLEVKDAVRDINTNSKRVEAYRVARELAAKRLEAEEKKLDVGLTTNYFVLQYQKEMATARSSELKALVDYNLALAKLEKAVGTSLDIRNIKITDIQ